MHILSRCKKGKIESFFSYRLYFAEIDFNSCSASSGGLVRKLMVIVRRAETMKAGTR